MNKIEVKGAKYPMSSWNFIVDVLRIAPEYEGIFGSSKLLPSRALLDVISSKE